MKHLTETIMEHAEGLPEGTPLVAKDLTHLGTRTGVNQALARLAKRGRLLRAERGIYFCPVKSRFGTYPPSVIRAIKGLAEERGETIVQHGAAAANALGLITQVPMRYSFLTSGRSRNIMLGNQLVKLRHAPSWQLVLADHPAGQVVRALAWLGPEESNEAIRTLKKKIPSEAFDIMAEVAHHLPSWLARNITRAVDHV
ncbi:DUF6088 family protein [Thioalkalivibrio sp. HK1]|uniref:DUF6088 family protein n=1 Tax=Thioalkalivibrio sp. HK1 TaxID=1469245 RepID=UPI0004723A0E|nr:DUF6088 family protein [Thioalkalivibrio sp. HK1]